MVVRVAKQAAMSGADEIIVATDHDQIRVACEAHGVKAIMTKPDWPTGTDRLAEVCELAGWADDTCIVNVQGDEPLIEPDLINQLAQTLISGQEHIATFCHPMTTWADFLNPNFVKVVIGSNHQALYFSRAPIPFPRDLMSTEENLRPPFPINHAFRHIGMYAYRVGFLRAYPRLTPTQAEQSESLEQLRALGHGYRIKVCIIAEAPDGGVDTPDDVDRVRRLLKHS